MPKLKSELSSSQIADLFGDVPEDRTNSMTMIDAAAKYLQEFRIGKTLKQIIAGIAERGYWKSPSGKTPEATLRVSLEEEIKGKGENSRFVRHDLEIEGRREILYGASRRPA